MTTHIISVLEHNQTRAREYRGTYLPELIREVLLTEFDLSPMDFPADRYDWEGSEEELPHEITQCYENPTLGNLITALDPFAGVEHWKEGNHSAITISLPVGHFVAYLTGEDPVKSHAALGCLDAIRFLPAGSTRWIPSEYLPFLMSTVALRP